MRKLVLSVLLPLALCACTKSAHLLAPRAQPRPSTAPAAVQIFAAAPADRPYLVLGSVAADAVSTQAAVEALQAEAASIGAQSVIHVRLTKLVGYTARTGISGTAVIWATP